jgi:hypothetical protein
MKNEPGVSLKSSLTQSSVKMSQESSVLDKNSGEDAASQQLDSAQNIFRQPESAKTQNSNTSAPNGLGGYWTHVPQPVAEKSAFADIDQEEIKRDNNGYQIGPNQNGKPLEAYHAQIEPRNVHSFASSPTMIAKKTEIENKMRQVSYCEKKNQELQNQLSSGPVSSVFKRDSNSKDQVYDPFN